MASVAPVAVSCSNLDSPPEAFLRAPALGSIELGLRDGHPLAREAATGQPIQVAPVAALADGLIRSRSESLTATFVLNVDAGRVTESCAGGDCATGGL